MPADLRSTIFNIKHPAGKAESGSLLVAEPFLQEECFNHAVILLVDHAEGYASMGLTLNKPTTYTLNDVTSDVDRADSVPLFSGGPVGEDRMFYLHTLGNIFNGSIEIIPGLYIGGDYDQVLQYISDGYPTEGIIRFFIGYSGWEPGQLDRELKQSVWAVTRPADSSLLLTGEQDSFWHRTVRSMGPDYRGWLFHPMYPGSN
ncbi:MAG: YqgE/AlgH family protein [Clostridiales bacterium]|nr:YqgE/AlgH family protein [Clostridiales bacterium]